MNFLKSNFLTAFALILIASCGGTAASPESPSGTTTSGESSTSETPTQSPDCQAGERKQADDGCNSCMCSTDGHWACTEMACVDKSEAPVSSPTPQQCQDGETKASDDGCNSCMCVKGGIWACTKRACFPSKQPTSNQEAPTSSIASCPAASGGAQVCAQVIVWSKDPASGTCCQYSTPCDAPKGWKQFGNSATCKASK